jgi:hypothetical protein
MGASEEGEMHLVMDAIISYPVQCCFTFILFLFLSREWLGDTALA